MITQIKDAEGNERLAIVFDEHFTLDELSGLQQSILWVIRATTDSQLFGSLADDLAAVTRLFAETLFTESQMRVCQKALFPKD